MLCCCTSGKRWSELADSEKAKWKKQAEKNKNSNADTAAADGGKADDGEEAGSEQDD